MTRERTRALTRDDAVDRGVLELFERALNAAALIVT
jgi:hypothetical protein